VNCLQISQIRRLTEDNAYDGAITQANCQIAATKLTRLYKSVQLNHTHTHTHTHMHILCLIMRLYISYTVN